MNPKNKGKRKRNKEVAYFLRSKAGFETLQWLRHISKFVSSNLRLRHLKRKCRRNWYLVLESNFLDPFVLLEVRGMLEVLVQDLFVHPVNHCKKYRKRFFRCLRKRHVAVLIRNSAESSFKDVCVSRSQAQVLADSSPSGEQAKGVWGPSSRHKTRCNKGFSEGYIRFIGKSPWFRLEMFFLNGSSPEAISSLSL